MRRSISGIGRWLCFVTCVFAAGLGNGAWAAEPLTLAVAPQFDQRRLFSSWKPVVDEIARRAGVELRVVTTLSVPEFEKAITKGSFEFVYANPYHIVREIQRQGYIPLVRDKTPLRGILVVRKDDPVQSPAELDGRTLAVPSLNALGASLLVRADLEQQFHVKLQPLNAKTHSSVYLHVANGLADAGGGVNKTFDEQDAPVKNALRILYTTREMPSHPVAAHPRVPRDIREKVQRAFLELGATEAGRKLLDPIPMDTVVATSIKDYQPMTQWGLDRYWVE